MSYYNLTDEEQEYTPEDLAEELNMDLVTMKAEKDVEILLTVAQAFEQVQQLRGDDSVKWNALESLVEALNLINPEATIVLEEDKIGVKADK